jgi:hypothetical protein
MKRVSLAEY